MSLFKDQEIVFEKIAAMAILGDDTANWPMEIQSAVLKNYPFLTNYLTNVEIERQDPVQGYAWGAFKISPKTGQNFIETMVIRAPIIVKEKRLYPVDVFEDLQGVYWPMTETRVQEALVQVNEMDGVAPEATPTRGTMPEPNEYVVKQSSLLEKVVPLSTTAQRDAFVKTASDPSVVRLATTHGKTGVMVKVGRLGMEKTAARKDTLVAPRAGTPAAILIKTSDWKTATISRAYSDPSTIDTMKVSIDEVATKLIESKDDFDEFLKTGSYVRVVNPSYRDVPPCIPAKDITEDGGPYEVKLASGVRDVGNVFSGIVDLAGNDTGRRMFIGKHASAVADRVLGIESDQQLALGLKAADLTNPVNGEGVLLFKEASGIKMSYPIDIRSRFVVEKRASLEGVDYRGRPFKIEVAPGLKSPMMTKEGHYMVPENTKFVALPRVTALDPAGFTKTASAPPTAIIRAGHRTSTVSDEGCGLSKLAKLNGLPDDELSFLMGAVGVPAEVTMEKIAESRKKQAPVNMYTPRSVTFSQFEKVATVIRQEEHDTIHRFVQPRQFIKHAMFLDDETSVDRVLALGFLTPENIDMFVQDLPNYEQLLNSLSELLISARLGLKDIPEEVLEPLIRYLDKTVTGLRMLQLRSEAVGDFA